MLAFVPVCAGKQVCAGESIYATKAACTDQKVSNACMYDCTFMCHGNVHMNHTFFSFLFLEQLCLSVCVQVRKYVMEEVNKAGKAKKLRGFEMIKSVWLDEEPWSGGPLT